MSNSSLSSQLQDYLSKSGSSSSLLSKTSNSTSSGGAFQTTSTGEKIFSWFKFPKSTSSDNLSEETTNGWFSEAQKDPLLPSLSKKQRIFGFAGCLLMGTLCLSLATLYLPFLVLKARKFAILYTLGSLFVILSFSMLWGPVNHMKHLFSLPRLPFSVTYLVTMVATLYFAMSVQSVVLTVVFAVLQVLALIWYLVSYIPGGQRGLQFFSKLFYAAASKGVQKTLPV